MSITVKILVFDSKGRILLVYEKGDGGRFFSKRPGWGLPGGGVESQETIEDIYKEIVKLLHEGNIFKEELLIYIPKNNPQILAAIREMLEETGFLIKVNGEILRENHFNGHETVVYRGEIIDGCLRRESEEISDAQWFYYDELPAVDESLDITKAVYSTDRSRIDRCLEVLGLRARDLDYLRWITSEEKDEKASTLSNGKQSEIRN